MKHHAAVFLALLVLGSEAHQVASGIFSHAKPAMPITIPGHGASGGKEPLVDSGLDDLVMTSVDVSTFSDLSNAIASNTVVNVVSNITFADSITISGVTNLVNPEVGTLLSTRRSRCEGTKVPR